MLLDTGNFSDKSTPEGEIRSAGLIGAMDRLDYAVVNVGERDVRDGFGKLRSRTAGSSFVTLPSAS